MYRAFNTVEELLENNHRIVKHKSLINVPDTSANFYIYKGKAPENKLLIHVICPVKVLWKPHSLLEYKSENVHVTITPEEFVKEFIFYDTKEPCGILIK